MTPVSSSWNTSHAYGAIPACAHARRSLEAKQIPQTFAHASAWPLMQTFRSPRRDSRKTVMRMRRGFVKTLRVTDAVRARPLHMLRTIDMSGDGAAAGGGGDLAGRRHHGTVDLVLHHAADQLAGNLHVVHGEFLEMQKGGKSAAEIVERDAAAELARGAHETRDPREMLHCNCLGNFETHLLRPQRTRLEFLRKKVRELIVVKRVRREVDADIDIRRERRGLAERAQGRADHPAVELAQHAMTFGGRDEGTRQ